MSTKRNQFIDHINSDYVSPIALNTKIIIQSAVKTIIPLESTLYNKYYLNPGGYHGEKNITITKPDGSIEVFDVQGGEFLPTASGIYIIRYNGAVRHSEPNLEFQDSPFTIAFPITAVPNYDPLPKWTIASVIDRVLNLAEPHLTNVAPRFKLDPAQREELSKIESPEFAFTKKTLKEILDAIGGFIHGIPRLIKGESGKLDTIHFDMLGGTEQALLADPKYDRFCVTNIKTNSIESYASELDSTTDNIVNVLDKGGGTITEPYEGGYKTVRTEDVYAKVLESNMEIVTAFPIYSVNKVEVMLENGKTGDITPYVFEQSDYGRLSSYDGAYPTSKAFALCYTLGQKGIRGLNYEAPTVYGGATANYAITNIIRAVTGTDFAESWWDDAKYARLRFRVTYTPIFSARVLQHKPHLDIGALPRALNYSQGANLIESKFYGENLKGVIARMGNPEIVRTYKLANTPNGKALIPKAGQAWGEDYFVSAVSCAEFAEHIDCTVGLTKDFNRLSQYIGINSQWRAYEISERSAHNRDIVYRDFAALGATEEDINGAETSIANLDSVLKALVMTFTQKPDPEINGVSSAVVSGYVNNTLQSTVTLPVISTAFGNSLVFNFYMADNFSAGDRVEYKNNGDVKGYWQTSTQYPDYYGRLDYVDFKLSDGKADTDIDTAFELPRGAHGGNYTYFSPSYARGLNNGLVVDKDGGETLRFNYELAFVTMNEWKSIIIGPALTHNCPLVNPIPDDEKGEAERAKHAAALYVMPEKVSKFASRIDTNKGVLICKYDEPDRFGEDPITAVMYDGSEYYNSYIQITAELSMSAGKAWVIADQATGDILLAQNVEIKQGEYIRFPQLRLAHFIHKLP